MTIGRTDYFKDPIPFDYNTIKPHLELHFIHLGYDNERKEETLRKASAKVIKTSYKILKALINHETIEKYPIGKLPKNKSDPALYPVLTKAYETFLFWFADIKFGKWMTSNNCSLTRETHETIVAHIKRKGTAESISNSLNIAKRFEHKVDVNRGYSYEFIKYPFDHDSLNKIRLFDENYFNMNIHYLFKVIHETEIEDVRTETLFFLFQVYLSDLQNNSIFKCCLDFIRINHKYKDIIYRLINYLNNDKDLLGNIIFKIKQLNDPILNGVLIKAEKITHRQNRINNVLSKELFNNHDLNKSKLIKDHKNRILAEIKKNLEEEHGNKIVTQLKSDPAIREKYEGFYLELVHCEIQSNTELMADITVEAREQCKNKILLQLENDEKFKEECKKEFRKKLELEFFEDHIKIRQQVVREWLEQPLTMINYMTEANKQLKEVNDLHLKLVQQETALKLNEIKRKQKVVELDSVIAEFE